MNTFHHGVRVREFTEGSPFVRLASTAIIGMLAVADDADPAVFPANELVQITNVNQAIASAGTQGTLANALQAIADQCSPIIHVVRVLEGNDTAATTANVLGENVGGVRTGLQLLATAKQKFDATPTILGAPGLDTLEVANALVTLASQTRGFCYVTARKADGTVAADTAEAIAYRNNFDSRHVMIIHPQVTVANEERSAIAYALGLRALLDETHGFQKSLSNIPINGVTGISTDVSWDLQNPNTDAGLLNAAEVTTLVNEKGFRFWGSRTAATDANFAFENVTRTANVLADTIAQAYLWAVDRGLHPSLATDIVEGLNATGRNMVAAEQLLGFEAWIDPDLNTPQNLKAGQLSIDYAYTAVPPLEDLTFNQRITERFLLDFTANIGA